MGSAFASGLINHKIPVKIPMVAKIETGICHVITLVISIQTKPMSRAKAAISPSEPPIAPINSCIWLGIWSASELIDSPLLNPSLTIARGVAPVAASIYLMRDSMGKGQLVICTGKDISKNTRPTRAGLNGLRPSPPKVILPTPMATRAPITTIHHGRFAGRLKARIKPVTRAEPSEMEGLTFSKYF